MEALVKPETEERVIRYAREVGMTPEALAGQILEERFASIPPSNLGSDATWEELVLSIAVLSGVSLSNEILSSEGLYD
jgi:hypothetical protein